MILIGLPRTGTTWVQEYIHAAHKGVLLPQNNSDEFFNPYYIHKDIDKKIKFLESARSNNIDVYVKYFPEHISDDIISKYHHTTITHKHSDTKIWPWFKEFYKDTNVLILKRRSLWKSYISSWFHITINSQVPEAVNNLEIHPWHNFNSDDEDRLLETIKKYNIQFKFNPTFFEYYTETVRFLNNDIQNHFTNAEIIWLEDLTHEFLQNKFNVEITPKTRPFKLDCEDYFSNEELSLMKEKYNERFESEFKLYGYSS